MLSWRSELALVKLLRAGESTGYGRRFVAAHDTWIGVVPVGYADGFRRDLAGTEVLVDGERRRVVGTVSMDAVAVELDHELPAGTPVTIVGDGCCSKSTRALPGRSPTSSRAGSTLRPSATRREVVRAREQRGPPRGAARRRARPRSPRFLDELLVLDGDERVLDVGAGTGAFAFAVAPRVREVVAVEQDEELAARARATRRRTSRS